MLLLEQFKEKRAQMHLTNAQIAERSGLSLSTVNSVFSGVAKNPSLVTAGAICAVLGISLDGLFGIENSEMVEQEIARVREEHEQHKEELNKRIEEHSRNILLNEVTIANDKEIIRRQDLRIENLQDRIKSQVQVINIFRVWILALHIYAIVMDSMVPDAGLIRGLDWANKPTGLVTVIIAVVLAGVLAFWAALKMRNRRK